MDDTTEIPVDLLRHVDEAGPASVYMNTGRLLANSQGTSGQARGEDAASVYGYTGTPRANRRVELSLTPDTATPFRLNCRQSQLRFLVCPSSLSLRIELSHLQTSKTHTRSKVQLPRGPGVRRWKLSCRGTSCKALGLGQAAAAVHGGRPAGGGRCQRGRAVQIDPKLTALV